MTPERITLPTRRLSVIRECRWMEHRFLLDIGFYPGLRGYDMGKPGEVFVDMPGQLGDTLRDAATVISVAMQHGLTVEALAKSLGEEPDLLRGKDATKPASAIGVILAEVAAEIAEQAVNA